MIRLVEGKENTIKVNVASSIDTTGFSIKIMASSNVKTIPDVEDGKTYDITFTADDVSAIPSSPFYGLISIIGSDGEAYQNSHIEIQKVHEIEWYKAIDFSSIPVTIAANWVGIPEDGGGGGGDMSKYATKDQLAKTSAADRQYTDEKVSDVIIDALENQTVTVKDKDGQEVTRTVKESMQETEDLKGDIDTRLKGGTKEEYNETIYLYTGDMPRKSRLQKSLDG